MSEAAGGDIPAEAGGSNGGPETSPGGEAAVDVVPDAVATVESTVDAEDAAGGEEPAGAEEVSKKRKNLSPTSSDAESEDGDSTAGAMQPQADDDNQYDMGDGFMVGDEEGDDGGQRRKKSRTKVERKRLRKNVDKVVLDEDDLAIVEENKEDDELAAAEEVGADGEDGGGSDGGDDFISPDMQQIGGVNQADDELDDFIIDEGSDDEKEPGAGGEGERAIDTAPVAPFASGSRRQASQQFAMGPTQDEVQESMDIFGIEDLNDLDLDDLDYRGDEDGEDGGVEGVGANAVEQEAAAADASKGFDPARQKIERQTLIDNFYTERDEEIRGIDYPERLHHIVQGRSAPDDQERTRQAEWMSSKLCDVMIAEAAKKGGTYIPTADTLSQSLVEPIKSVLQFLQGEMLEVPFIWAYRKDYLHEKMTRKHLWFILALDEKWEKMFTLQSRILTDIETLGDYERFASGADVEDELQSRSAKITELYKMLEESGEKISALRIEYNATLDAIDNGELDDTEISSYREKVSALQEELSTEEANSNGVEKLLKDDRAEYEKVKQVSGQIAQYRSAGILDVNKLFPKDRFSTIVEQCFDEQELKDVQYYLDLLLRGATKDRGEVDLAADLKDGTTTVQRLQRKSALGGHGKDTTYRLHRKSAGLRQLVGKIFVSAPEAGDALRHGFPVELPECSLADHESACGDITNESYTLVTQVDVENAVNLLVATEYAAEPNIRRALRGQYRKVVTISTRPTTKGLNELTPFDPLFGLVFLDDMPIKDLYDERNKSLYMRLLQAEHDGFLTINYSKPLCTIGSYVDIENNSSAFSRVFGDLFAFFISQKSDSDGMESLQKLNGIRLKAMIDCCNNHLVPSFEEEARRDLTRLGKEGIIDEACEKFSSMLRRGPYRPPAMDRREDIKDVLMSCPRRPFYATVVCIYFSANPRQPIAMVYCDKDGVMLASDLIPPRAASRKVEMLSSFVRTNKPDVIVINAGGGRASRSTVALFEKTLIKEISETLKEESLERSQMNDYYGADDDEDGYDPKVIMVKDEIAEIFKQSPRSKKMFPDFDPSLCAAICLARYVQEPLAEYCNLWTSANSVGTFGIEFLFLKLHPLLHMAKSLRSSLLEKLQYCLVDAVCDVGVDINLAVSHDHLASMLIFVGGLGLRKANHLRAVIKEKLTYVSNRKELLERKVLKKNVWINASGFLRIDSMTNDSSSVDPLDNTRIHPECYYINEWAPKICADSLEVEWTSSLDYTDIVSNLMKDCKKVLERKVAKSKAWIDLWRSGRPMNGKTKYKETVKNDQGMLIEKEFGCELSDAMSLLLIDDYCSDLESQDMGRHRLQFEDIKEELRFPWLDLRQPIEGPSQSEMFTILTGETPNSLHVGMKIGCVITRVEDKEVFDNRTNVSRRQQRAQVVTDSGMKGFISMFEVSDDRIDENRFSMKEALPEGSKVMAVILSVNMERQIVDLSIRPSYLKSNESWWVKKRFELHHCRRWFEETARRGPVEKLFMPHFNEGAALAAYEENLGDETDADKMAVDSDAPLSASKSTKAVVQRHVQHPLFINCSGKEAEERLRANQGGFGSVIIRPSSKGPDSLAITWGFQPNWFMHFEVDEKGKAAGALGLGKELYIKYANLNEPFSDLDEVFARFVDPMNDYVSLMISHRNFRDGSPEEVEAFLFSQIQDRPQNIPYCIRFEPSFAGCFVLTWIKNPNSKDPIKKSRIQVMPNGYFMEKRYFSRPGEIIQYLKKHTEKTANRPIANAANEGGGRKSRFR